MEHYKRTTSTAVCNIYQDESRRCTAYLAAQARHASGSKHMEATKASHPTIGTHPSRPVVSWAIPIFYKTPSTHAKSQSYFWMKCEAILIC